jgi:hypothetical protein
MLPVMALVFLAIAAAAPQSAAPVHDKAFWQSIVDNKYEPPSADAVAPLLRELSQLLASPDPLLRDRYAASIIAAWIEQHRVPVDMLRPLTQEWSANLTDRIGSVGTDAVFKRSFSALMLTELVAADVDRPFLEPNDYRRLLTQTLDYLQAERDLRGFDAEKGWAHSAAHTADLLKWLARSPRFSRPDQRPVLDAIARKMREASVVFTHGEDERLARAVLAIVKRPDSDADGFDAWVKGSLPPRTATSLQDPAFFRARQNIVNLYAKLEVLLSLEDESTATPQLRSARDALRAALKRLF